MPSPKLSIIIIAYNTGKFISQAIRSVLYQTHKNLELIIINDGSTDSTKTIVEAFDDSRIRYFENEKNEGIVYSRNKGLELAKGEYIGMLDADDIAYPEKFEKQIDFLEKNNDFGMIGSRVKFIDKNGKQLPGSWKLKASPEMIPSIMLFKNYFLQSAVLYRRECIRHYSFKTDFNIGEDYLIWFDILKKWKAWNLQQYLVDYRIHNESITNKFIEEKLEKEKSVFKIILDELNINPSDEQLEIHLLIRNNRPINDLATLKLVEKWLLIILEKNKGIGRYNQKMLTKVVFNRWLKACSKSKQLHFKMLYYFVKSELSSEFIFRMISINNK